MGSYTTSQADVIKLLDFVTYEVLNSAESAALSYLPFVVKQLFNFFSIAGLFLQLRSANKCLHNVSFNTFFKLNFY